MLFYFSSQEYGHDDLVKLLKKFSKCLLLLFFVASLPYGKSLRQKSRLLPPTVEPWIQNQLVERWPL